MNSPKQLGTISNESKVIAHYNNNSELYSKDNNLQMIHHRILDQEIHNNSNGNKYHQMAVHLQHQMDVPILHRWRIGKKR